MSTVQRALKAFHACGMVTWVRRLWRNGTRVAQDTNAYLLTLGDRAREGGEPPNPVRCDRQADRQTCSLDLSRELSVAAAASYIDITTAQAALAKRRQAIEARLLRGGSGSPVPMI